MGFHEFFETYAKLPPKGKKREVLDTIEVHDVKVKCRRSTINKVLDCIVSECNELTSKISKTLDEMRG